MKQCLSFLKEKIKKNSYPLSAVVVLLVLIGLSFSFSYLKNKPENSPKKISWVTDIHADRFKRRTVDSGTIYPKKYTEYLSKVFKKLKKQKINSVISTGDNTNSGDDNYADELMRITNEEKMDVIWVRGNHDNDEVMSILGITEKQYYFRDIENTRIIVLDSTEYENGEYDYFGGISQNQLEWLKKTIATEKKVIIAMHIPIFDEILKSSDIDASKGHFSGVGDLLERYVELEEIFRKNNNVTMVLSGHWHVAWQKEYNGISYYGQAALTRDGEEGGYATINLENYEVEYKFAK